MEERHAGANKKEIKAVLLGKEQTKSGTDSAPQVTGGRPAARFLALPAADLLLL